MPQPSDEGGGVPVSVRYGGEAPFAAWRTTVASRHIRRGPSLIQKHELRDIQRRLGCLPLTPCGLHVGPLLLAGVQGFF